MAEHTPAPWKVAHRKGSIVVRGPATECIAVIPTPAWDGYGISNPEEANANARLIAAAPDLLEALKRQQANIRHWIETGVPATPEESKSISDQIDAAISKATVTP